jgi:putative membrane protein
MDLPFLLAIGMGMFTGVLVLSRVVTWANEANPAAMFAFFVGLIGASAIVLVREVRPFDRAETTALGLGILSAVIASGEPSIGSGHPLPLLFLAGMIAFSAMVMPGLSGSLLLVVLGQYTYLSETLTEFTNQLAGLATGEETALPVADGIVIVVFVAGGAVGIMTVARLVDAALERNRTVTLAFLVGLVIGALRAPLARVDENTGSLTPETIGLILLSIVVGALLVLLTDRYLYRIEL